MFGAYKPLPSKSKALPIIVSPMFPCKQSNSEKNGSRCVYCIRIIRAITHWTLHYNYSTRCTDEHSEALRCPRSFLVYTVRSHIHFNALFLLLRKEWKVCSSKNAKVFASVEKHWPHNAYWRWSKSFFCTIIQCFHSSFCHQYLMIIYVIQL